MTGISTTTADTADLVTVADGQPITTSDRLAAAAGVQHASLIRLVRRNEADLSAVSNLIGSAVRPRLAGQHGGGDTEYAVLTGPQAALLVTRMVRSPAVRALQIRLIRDFAAAAEELARRRAAAPPPVPALPTTYLDAMRELVTTLEASQRTTLALAAAETRIADQAPAVAAQARLATASGELCLRDAAKSLNIPPAVLLSKLASARWLYRRERADGRTGKWRAMQPRISAGLLVHRVRVYTDSAGVERTTDDVRVTMAGLAKMAELLAKGGTGP